MNSVKQIVLSQILKYLTGAYLDLRPAFVNVHLLRNWLRITFDFWLSLSHRWVWEKMSLFDNLDILSWLLIAFSLIAFISLFKRPAPYGKFSKKVLVNYSLRPKISWFIQESPSFFVPLFYLVRHFLNGWALWTPNVALLLCFGLHYFQRYGKAIK